MQSCSTLLPPYRPVRQLDRDSVRHRQRLRARHCAAPGDRGLGPAALPDLHCASLTHRQGAVITMVIEL